MDVERLRGETPATSTLVHLNNAGASLMPQPVVDEVTSYLRLESEIGGYETATLRAADIRVAYRQVAKLIGAQPHNVAFTENATVSTAQVLSAIRWNRGDAIVTTRNDYASNQIQFLALQKRFGIRVLRAEDRATGGVDVSSLDDLVAKHRPKLVCVTHIPTNSGMVQDVVGAGQICKRHDVLLLVDACQSIGQMPVVVEEIGCDFLSASSRKFLRGPRGCGFLYVSDRAIEAGLEPLFIDMHGANWVDADQYEPAADASRFENWESAWALVLGTGVAADYATSIGLDAIEGRIRMLSQYLRKELDQLPRVRLLDRGERLSSVVSIKVEGVDPDWLVTRLRTEKINTSAQKRVYAVIDFDDKGVEKSLRLSPHYFNTVEEIDRVVTVLKQV